MKKILLVEDTKHLSDEIEDILRLEGYQVSTAGNGVEALEILSSIQPDIIITDYLMPVMNGFEFIDRVKAITSLRSIPIVVLSAKASHEDKAQALARGADAFIAKPCKGEELISVLSNLLK